MKYLDEFRDSAKASILAREIEALVASMDIPDDKPLNIMEVCGGHTHSIFRYGVEGMLPKQIELVHGPGCPVCVLPMGRVDDCVAIAEQSHVIFATFGDAMRVPGSRKSLMQAKADGADVRMVYSPMDALALARANPAREVVFFGLGFETTMPSTALTILQAENDGADEFFGVLQSHHHRPDHQGDPRQSGPPAGRFSRAGPRLDGDRHGALRVHRQILSQADGHRRLRAARHPAVDLDGPAADQGGPRRDRKSIRPRRSRKRQWAGAAAQSSRVYELREFFEWRGLGSIDHSGVKLRDEYSRFDAERKFAIPNVRIADPKSCQCGEVLTGAIKPWQCKVFGSACTPETPVGALMVSSEGACAAYYQYGGVKHHEATA